MSFIALVLVGSFSDLNAWAMENISIIVKIGLGKG